MNRHDPFHEIDDLLRSKQPDPRPSSGLESRILLALESHERPVAFRFRPWFVLPPVAAAVAIIAAWPGSNPTAEPTAYQNPSPVSAPAENPLPEIASIYDDNPLQKESQALRRDAERAGNFLIDCLPSLGSQGD